MASCVYIDGKMYAVDGKEHPDVFAAHKAFDDIISLTEEYLSNNKANDSNKRHSGKVRYKTFSTIIRLITKQVHIWHHDRNLL